MSSALAFLCKIWSMVSSACVGCWKGLCSLTCIHSYWVVVSLIHFKTESDLPKSFPNTCSMQHCRYTVEPDQVLAIWHLLKRSARRAPGYVQSFHQSPSTPTASPPSYRAPQSHPSDPILIPKLWIWNSIVSIVVQWLALLPQGSEGPGYKFKETACSSVQVDSFRLHSPKTVW